MLDRLMLVKTQFTNLIYFMLYQDHYGLRDLRISKMAYSILSQRYEITLGQNLMSYHMIHMICLNLECLFDLNWCSTGQLWSLTMQLLH